MRVLRIKPGQMNTGKKLLFTVSATLLSPLAQAHDNSHSISFLAHIQAHGIEIINANTNIIIGLLLLASIFAGRFFAARLRARTATAHHG